MLVREGLHEHLAAARVLHEIGRGLGHDDRQAPDGRGVDAVALGDVGDDASRVSDPARIADFDSSGLAYLHCVSVTVVPLPTAE